MLKKYEKFAYFDEITTKIVAFVICGSLVILTLATSMSFPEITDYLSIFLIFGSIILSIFILIKKIFNSKKFHLLFWLQLSIIFCFFILIFGRTYYTDIGDNIVIFLEICIAVTFLLFLVFIKHKKYYYFLLILITFLGALLQFNNISIFSKHSSIETYTVQEKYIDNVRKSITDNYIFVGKSLILGKIEDNVGVQAYKKYNVGDEISVHYYKGLIGLDFYRY